MTDEPVEFPERGAFFTKLPIPVYAKRMAGDFQVRTLEGTMKGSAGDWLITGPGGEKWPIKDDIFRETYKLTEAIEETVSRQPGPLCSCEKYEPHLWSLHNLAAPPGEGIDPSSPDYPKPMDKEAKPHD